MREMSMAKTEHLEKDRVLQLLAEADTKWFKSHSGQFNYREHLEFTADFLAKNCLLYTSPSPRD